MSDPTKHNYFQKVMNLAATLPKGASSHVMIQHDDWCELYRGIGQYCNCNPNVFLDPEWEKKHGTGINSGITNKVDDEKEG